MSKLNRYKPIRILWILLGSLSVGMGVIGIFVPGWPTTIFLIVASYFYIRSSRRLYNWLINNKLSVLSSSDNLYPRRQERERVSLRSGPLYDTDSWGWLLWDWLADTSWWGMDRHVRMDLVDVAAFVTRSSCLINIASISESNMNLVNVVQCCSASFKSTVCWHAPRHSLGFRSRWTKWALKKMLFV